MAANLTSQFSKAIIHPLGDESKKVECMFNPSEYTISKSNIYTPRNTTQKENPEGDFSSVGAKELRLSLIFDTYDTGENVNNKTDLLWEFMRPKENLEKPDQPKYEPTIVVFKWGCFEFEAIIRSLSQQFTLFSHDGTPVRAKVDVDFTQYEEPKTQKEKGTNPTSGGGPVERVWQVISGDRLDNIAQKVYQDSSKWRLIAECNHLPNPLALRAGMILRIPED